MWCLPARRSWPTNCNDRSLDHVISHGCRVIPDRAWFLWQSGRNRRCPCSYWFRSALDVCSGVAGACSTVRMTPSVKHERHPHHLPPRPRTRRAYPHARRVGDFLFVSGIGPRKRDQKEIPGTTLDAHGNVLTYDVTVECKQVFENIRVIIEDAGAKWENIVDVTSFLTDMKRDFAAYNKAYEEAFGQARPTAPPSK